jgi:hypothetical protein
VRVENLDLPEQTVVRGWLKDYAKEVLVVRQVFTNKDGSTGKLHLASSDLTCSYDAITTTYKKRWQVEVFHKSLKSNANLAKSPTRTLRTQSNHVFLSICAAFKLECLSLKTNSALSPSTASCSSTLPEQHTNSSFNCGLLRNITYSFKDSPF